MFGFYLVSCGVWLVVLVWVGLLVSSVADFGVVALMVGGRCCVCWVVVWDFVCLL